MTWPGLVDEPLETWPRKVNGRLVEPATGFVRIRRAPREPLEVSVLVIRRLADRARNGRRHTLLAAAAEAERQRHSLLALHENGDA